MSRILGLLVFLLVVLPVQAQLPLFNDPTVWISAGFGTVAWTPDGLSNGERDNVMNSFSVGAASRRWMVQGGLQISDYYGLFGDDLLPSLAGSEGTPATYRSAYAMGGMHTASRWFMGGTAVGPAVTWGTRVGEIQSPSCPPGNDLCFDDLPVLEYERDRYLNLGLVGSVQGFVRLDGRVWLGGETMAVANKSSSHLATRIAVRVDLLRPDR